MKFLQAKAAADATATMFQKALAAAKAAPDDKAKASAAATLAATLTGSYQVAIDAAAGEPALTKQRDALIEAKVVHREKYEKVTTETDPPASEEKSSAMSGEDAAAASSGPPTKDSEAASVRGAKAPKLKGPKMGGDEKDDEKAIAAAYGASASAYRKAIRGSNVDAYGALRGPEALLSAVMKALGTKTVGETFGALAELPEKLAAHAEVASRVERLERGTLEDKINAIVAQGKAEGRTRGKDDRKKLRAFGMKHGAEELRGTLKMRDARKADAFRPKEDEAAAAGREQFQGDDAQTKAVLAEALAGIPKEQRAEYEKLFMANLAATNAVKIPAA